MTDKERVRCALLGEKVDRFPAAFLYSMLYFEDHFSELTGRPQWQMYAWQHSEPDEHLAVWDRMLAKVPLEILQPQYCPSRAVRAAITFSEENGRIYKHDSRSGKSTDVTPGAGHARDYKDNEEQTVFDSHDIREKLKVTPAEAQIAAGCNDLLDALVARHGPDRYICSGGVIGTLYCCSTYVGMTNLFEMLHEQKGFIHELSSRILEQNIEAIRQYCAAGGDAIYIDDATATSDMISPAHYEEFCLPYLKQMVDEIRRHDHQAILIYFGGVMDRLEQIASLGADALAMETAMKNYTNDIGEAAGRIGSRMSLFGNIDPVGIMQEGTDEQLAAEIRRQAMGGARARGFVHSTGSPITPATPLSRVQRYFELARGT